MKAAFLLLLLLAPSLALHPRPLPRRQNTVSKVLRKLLAQALEKLSSEGASLPLLDLGRAGNFSGVSARAWGARGEVDGAGSFGFRARVNASRAAVEGAYHVVGLDVPGLFPVFGKGDFRVEMEAIEVNMTLGAEKNFTTDKLDFDLTEFGVRMSSSKVKFDNLMDDPHVADFLNELLSNLLPDLVSVLAHFLAEDDLPALIDVYGNGLFACLTEPDIRQCIKDLLKGTLPFLRPPPPHSLFSNT